MSRCRMRIRTRAAGGEFLADETEFALFESNHQLSAIQAIADAFRDVPGRKALVYFLAGLTSRGIENDDQLRWTADLCNRANISIYSVDARGLVALSPGGGAHRSGRGTGHLHGPGGPQPTGPAQPVARGGSSPWPPIPVVRVLLDDNDLGKIFRKAQEDSRPLLPSGLLRSRPTPRRPLPQGRGHRQPARAPPRLPAGLLCGQTLRRLESNPEKEFKLLQTVLEGDPKVEFPVEISAEYFPDFKGGYRVPVLAAFDRTEFPSFSESGRLNTGSDHPGPAI